MPYKTIKVFAYFLLSFSLVGCIQEGPDFPAGRVQGYRPIYVTPSMAAITFVEAKPVQVPGKIYRYGNFLLVNEQRQGIHVFDNTDPSKPVALGFLAITGNVDMAINNNVLYADQAGSIVALDISDLTNIKELSRIKTAGNLIPPMAGYYFECVDPEKGEVLSWELASLDNPTCYR